MKLLGIDLETTGLNTDKCQILEVGAVLWDTETQEPVTFFSEYNSDIKTKKIKARHRKEIRKITGIEIENVVRYGKPFSEIMERILSWDFDEVVAHNGTSFDRPILKRVCKKAKIGAKSVFKKSWIDTLIDVDYPDHVKRRNLQALAAEHFMVNYWPHRAATDVLIMMSILSRYDLKKVVKNARSPLVHVKYQGKYNKDINELVKEAGFKYDSSDKSWNLRTRKRLLEKEYLFPTTLTKL